MAHSNAVLVNPDTGETTEAPVGFSWTTFFFGMFPALLRGDFKWTAIIFVVALLVGPFSGVIFSFFYNKKYIKEMVSSGWRVKSDPGKVSKYIGFERSKIAYSAS